MIKKVIILTKNMMKYAKKVTIIIQPTNKIDDGLKLQCDDLDRLGSAVGELAIQLEMKREKKSRKIMSKLAQEKKEAPWSTIAVVDDPESPWKKVQPKYHRTPIDFTVLDDVGIIGAGSNSGKAGGRSRSIRSDGRRTSVSTLTSTSSRCFPTDILTARKGKTKNLITNRKKG